MFVDIEDFKSALVVENILTPYKKGRFAQDKKTRLPKEPITPEVCMEVLKSTNYARNIKDMLQCIADLPMHEQAQCKDVVLAVFSNREQPQSVWDLGRKLAETSGYKKEFDEACVLKEGIIIDSAPYYSTGLGVGTEPLSYEDLATHSKLIAVGDKINFKNVGNLPAVVDVSRCRDVTFNGCDFELCQELCLGDDIKGNFDLSSYLPRNLDFTKFSDFQMFHFKFKDFDEVKFRKGAKIKFEYVSSFPNDFDVSQCAEVVLRDCKMKNVQKLVFADGAKVDLSKCSNIRWEARRAGLECRSRG